MAGRGETKVRFILGTAAVQLDISALEAAKTYTVRLAPLDEADLTGEEKAVLAAYAEDLSMFTVRIVRETDGADMTDEIAAAGKLEILLADPGDGLFGILYLIEKRGQTQGRPASQVMDGTSETEAGRAWLKITAPGSGIFGLCSVG